MFHQKKIICVIPARLASTRFPSKMIANLAGRPLLAWVWEAAQRVTLFDDVVFAIDAKSTADVINSFGGRYIMTDPACKSGTYRLVELLTTGKIQADILVNWQGDEPFITPDMVTTLLQTCNQPEEEMWTLKKLIQKPEQIFAPNIAKVVCDLNGFAMLFSRAPIPFFRDERDPAVLLSKKIYYKHVGLYAFTAQALQKIAKMGDSLLEDAEKLEMLPLLEHGLRIRVHETDQEVFGIDTTADLAQAEAHVQNLFTNKKQKQTI